MIKVIGVLGLPGTGKSTLFRRLIEEFMQRSSMLPAAAGLAVGEEYPGVRVVVLGKYAPEHDFPGTDRLSMAAQKDCLEYLSMLNGSPRYNGSTVLFEGDRLATISFFEQLQQRGILFEIYILTAPQAMLEQRRIDRGSKQSETFIKGRETKLRNICERFSCHELPNATFANQKALVEELLLKTGITRKAAATV
jgi:hypothetical protein